jgi:hypothetical protein
MSQRAQDRLQSLPRPNSGLPEFGTMMWSKSDRSDLDWGRVAAEGGRAGGPFWP